MRLKGLLSRRLRMVGMVFLITALVSLVPVRNAQSDDYLDWINYNTLNGLQTAILSLQNSVNALQADAAGTLYTPALLVDPDSYARCNVTNIGTTAINVTLDVLDGSGSSQIGGPHSVSVNPGVTVANFFGFASVNVCKFTVPSKNGVRANMCVSKFATLDCYNSADAH